MFNPNGINSSGNEHEDTSSAENMNEAPENNELDKKLGEAATAASSESRNILRANDEISRDLNLKSLQDYLTDVNIDPKTAGILLASGAFDTKSSSGNYRMSLWNEKNEDGVPYIKGTTRNMAGFRSSSGHEYKVFEKDGILIVYDSMAGTVKRRYSIDELPYEQDPIEFKITTDQVTFIDPSAEKTIATGIFRKEEYADLAPTGTSVMRVNDENLSEDLKKFKYEVKDQERFNKLNAQE